jgi:hypothetical protein
MTAEERGRTGREAHGESRSRYRELALEFEQSVERAGFHGYFEQINARGELIPPEAALGDMVRSR